MDQNPKTIEATVIAKDAVDDEPTVATRSKKTKRAASARRGGSNGGRSSASGSVAVPATTSASVNATAVKAAPAHVAASAGVSKSKAKSEERVGNRVRATRIDVMMSKAELARRAGISVLTIDRVEKGLGCRMDTKRKILEALGLSLADRVRVFGEEE